MNKSTSVLSKLGPGLLYAGAAIGVSHLVQSTRAGASFGIAMILVVIIVNYLKYPFFQYGTRYVAATGKSLLHGYQRLGNWAIWLFFLLTLGTMFILQGAVTLVTAGLAKYITGTDLSTTSVFVIILILSASILFSGKIKILDKIMKVVMVVLAVTTIAAAISSFYATVDVTHNSTPFSFSNRTHIFFLIAFIGWMPAPIDISVWYSVWSESSLKEQNQKAQLKTSLFDFSIGYWGTAFLALCFVILGANMLHNTGTELSGNAVIFSGQIIEAYSNSLGTWATPIISVAAFTTMLSTTISVMDGITRVMVPTSQLLAKKEVSSSKPLFVFWLSILGIGSYFLIRNYASNMRQMVDFATTISFLTAPVLAYLNIRVMGSSEITNEFKPSKFTLYTSYLGLAVLVAFTFVYAYFKFLTS